MKCETGPLRMPGSESPQWRGHCEPQTSLTSLKWRWDGSNMPAASLGVIFRNMGIIMQQERFP